MDIQKSKLGDCNEVASTLCLIGSCLKRSGDYSDAESAYNEALQMLESINGDKHISLVDALMGMAELKNCTEEYDEATEYHVECLEIQKSAFGKIHDSIADTVYAMGLSKHNQGNYSRALVFFTKSIEIRTQLHGENHPSIGDAHNLMGFVEAKNGDLDAALCRLEDALRVRKMLGNRLKEAETLLNIGHVHREKNQFELALEHYDDCLSIRIAELGKGDVTVSDALMAIGNVKSDMAQHDGAVSSYKEGKTNLIC